MYGHSQVIMVVADGLVPVWHQGIGSHHGDTGRSTYISRLSERGHETCSVALDDRYVDPGWGI